MVCGRQQHETAVARRSEGLLPASEHGHEVLAEEQERQESDGVGDVDPAVAGNENVFLPGQDFAGAAKKSAAADGLLFSEAEIGELAKQVAELRPADGKAAALQLARLGADLVVVSPRFAREASTFWTPPWYSSSGSGRNRTLTR